MQATRAGQPVELSLSPSKSSSDVLAVLLAAALSWGVLWFGGAAIESMVLSQPLSTRDLPESSFSGGSAADYGRAFAYTVAPVREELSRGIQRVTVSTRDFVPLPWGKGYA